MTDTAKKPENVVRHPNVEDAAKAAPTPAKRGKRGPLFAGLAAVVLIGAVGYGAWYMLVGSKSVSTDNAYVNADSAMVTPAIAGTVREVKANDTQAVHKGDVLVTIDDTDAKLAVLQAQAMLTQAEQRVRGYYATNEALAAQIAARGADQAQVQARIVSAQADVERARVDLDRRKNLAQGGAVSGEELTSAQNAFATAQANLTAARASQAAAAASRSAAVGTANANLVLTRGLTVETSPEVAAAKARLDQANVDLDRTVVRAPIDGVVAKRQVQIGQRVAQGAPLMMVVPVGQAYVDANFKEVQLKKVRAGQPVELESDLYGGGVKFSGRVVGLAGGTGSAFAVIPSQNATGNWIKVVQRVPVRIALDPKELQDHPLRLGLSMKAKIKIAE